MTNRKIHIFLLFFVIIALSISVPKVSLSRVEIQETGSNLIAGRNVNMVSGTVLPGGDPWLQRQNEPSIAVSTRNPLHLLAGANDYRTVDVPFSQGSLPGLPEGTAAAGDAWLGVFKSFDGGQSWQTTLLPGYPQDVSDEGASSPLMGLQAAADPTVRAGASGLFFYSGIAFNRVENGTSVIFVSRYMDNNNTETGDSIDYIDTTIIDVGNSGQFGDKPWIAVDKPRDGQTAFINGQDVPVGDIYIVYSIFLGDLTLNIHNKIMFVKSSDYGNTWSNPQKLSESQRINQGTTIAVAPDGTIYVAWRRFASPDETDAIMFSRSTDGGKKFSKAFEVATIVPFDQPSINAFTLPGAAFRTNSFPTLTVGKDGDVFIAWAQRNMDGRAQIVLTSRTAKLNKWDLPATPIDPITQGHQFMPTLTYAAGKLTAAWYDSRNDFVAPCTPEMIADDPNCQFRHTIDVMAAQLDQYAIDPSWAMTQVSRYIYYLVENPTDPSGTGYSVSQMQFNPPNFPLFQGGTQPFMGDYIDISPSPKFITDDYGNWQFNTDPTGPSTFHIAWTDNRDVNPPPDTDWTLYNPPLGKDGQPNSPTPCSDGDRTGMRNQNIYTSQLTSSVRIGSPGNFKSTGEFGRAFVIIVENVSAADKYFLLEITDDDEGSTIVIDASFLPTSDLELLAVGIAPYSSISRSVFVEPNPDNPTAPIKVDVYEINPPTDPPGEPVVISGILGTLVLNLDPNNPDTGMWEETHNPNISSPTVFNWDIGDMGDPNVANPNILNPNILNPNILNPNILNPNILNPNILNPNILNPNILNPNILNPNILNPNILNPNILNPNILNPNILNPNILNPNILNTAVGDTDFSDASVTDVFWTVKNEGNTTSSYTFKTIAGEDIPIHFYSSLSIYRINFTAAAQGCDLGDVPQQDLILRVANPNILNPNILNPNILNPSIEDSAITNATFSLAPGEVAVAVLQVIDPGAVTSEASTESAGIMENGDEEPFDPNSFANSLATYVTAQSPNSDGEYAPIALQILTVKLPDGEYGVLYDQELFTIGGTGQYTWNIETIQGENPHPDLELVRIPGTTETPDEVYLRGTPFIGGEYTFTVKVTDESVPQQEDYQTYTLNVQSYFNLAATVEPAGSGSVSPAVGTYAEGTEVELIATPNTIDGYKFVNWTGNGVPEGQENTNPLIIIMNGGTDITANFELEEYTITASSGANGSISPLGEVIVEHGLSQTFTFEPALNYHLDEVLVDGAPVTLDEGILSYTFTNVTGIHTISVTYAIDQYAIAASSGANGAISPSGQVMVEHGSSQIFTMIPAEFHHVDAVQVDGAPVTLDENLSYTFTNVTGIHTISVTFEIDNYSLTVNTEGTGTGSVDVSPELVTYPHGTMVTLTANPDDSSDFTNWSGNLLGEDNSITFFMDSDKIITANFEIVYVNISGKVTVAGDGLGDVELTGFNDSIFTDSDGLYTGSVVRGFAGIIKPTKTSYTFDPISISYVENPVVSDVENQNYTVLPMQGTTISEPSDGDTVATAVATDSNGDVYVTGYKTSAANGTDFYTVKYDSAGLKTEAIYDGTAHGDDKATAIVVKEIDGNVYVYVTGFSSGKSSGADYCTIKYDSNLNQLWTNAARYDGPALMGDFATALAVDNSGNIYVTGYSYRGTVWKHSDYATVMYNNAGEEVWNARYDAKRNGNDEAAAIAVDSTGNVYITGKSQYSLNKNKDVLHYDYFTVKYNNSGSVVWDAREGSDIKGDDEATALAIAEENESIFIYVTGFMAGDNGNDFYTLKYNSSGRKVEEKVEFSDPSQGNSQAAALATQVEDGNVFVYVTGFSTGINGTDYFTVKYNSTLSSQWIKEYDGAAHGNDQATALAVDAQGVYVTGTSAGTGIGIFTVRYDINSGHVIWFANYDNVGDEVANAIAVGSSDVYVSGYRQVNSVDPKDFITLKYNK